MKHMNVTMVTAHAVLDALHRDGYCIIEGMLSPEEIAFARSSLAPVLNATSLGESTFNGTSTRRVTALFAKTRAFDKPATSPLILEILDTILGHYHLSAPMAIQIEPGEVDQVLHQDQGLFPLPSNFNEVIVNTMWAIDDFTEENGATRIIARSHLWIDKVPNKDDPITRVVMPAGSVMIYLGKVWHGGGANISEKPRLGVILEYAVGWLRPQETHLLSVPREIIVTLVPRLQRLLGYDVYPPVIGLADGRHPQTFLSNKTDAPHVS